MAERYFTTDGEEVDADLLVGLPPEDDPWRENELVRRIRLREDARRSLADNLAEVFELSEFICSFAGAATIKR